MLIFLIDINTCPSACLVASKNHRFAVSKLVLYVVVFLISISFCGCKNSHQTREKNFDNSLNQKENCAIVFYIPSEHEFLVQNEKFAQKRYTPCSSFKIISTLLALEIGLVDENSTMGYDGTKYEYETWNKELNLIEAFQSSCVWYYKKLIAKIDKKTMQDFLEKLHYGNCDLSVWNDNGHNVFWIESSLQISPKEQVLVLQQIFESKEFSSENLEVLKKSMQLDNVGDIKLYGKTGTGRNHNTNYLEGWFVGFFEKESGKPIYYAAHLADKNANIIGPHVRDNIRQIILENFQDK